MLMTICGPSVSLWLFSLCSRWFQLVLIAFTAPFFLFLVNAAPIESPFYPPIMLAVLFLIGWRMRVWVLKRLERKAPRSAGPLESRPGSATSAS